MSTSFASPCKMETRTVLQFYHRGRARRLAIGSRVALAGFLTIFLGFYLYHTLVAYGVITPVVRGYFVAICVLALPVVGTAYVQHIRASTHRLHVDALFFGFTTFYFIVSGLGAAFGAKEAIVWSHFAVVPQWLTLFAIARLLEVTSREFAAAAQVTMGTMVALVLMGSSEGVFRYWGDYGDPLLVNYQGFGLVFMVAALFCAASLVSGALRIGVYAISIVTLFLIGARSEFIGFLVGALCLEASLSRYRGMLTAIVVALVATGVPLLLYLVQTMPAHRIVDLVFISDIGTVVERKKALEDAISTISEHPIWGDFGSYQPGSYAHNLLSAWVDLGVVGFSWLALLVFGALMDLARRYRAWRFDRQFALAISACATCALLLIASKAFFYMLVPIALGLYARFYAHCDQVSIRGPICVEQCRTDDARR